MLDQSFYRCLAAALRTVKAELGQTTSAADEDRDGDEEKTRSGTGKTVNV